MVPPVGVAVAVGVLVLGVPEIVAVAVDVGPELEAGLEVAPTVGVEVEVGPAVEVATGVGRLDVLHACPAGPARDQ